MEVLSSKIVERLGLATCIEILEELEEKGIKKGPIGTYYLDVIDREKLVWQDDNNLVIFNRRDNG